MFACMYVIGQPSARETLATTNKPALWERSVLVG